MGSRIYPQPGEPFCEACHLGNDEPCVPDHEAYLEDMRIGEPVCHDCDRLRTLLAEVVAPALQSAHDCAVFDVRDWSACRGDVWLYALLCGWDDASIAELSARYPSIDWPRLRSLQGALDAIRKELGE